MKILGIETSCDETAVAVVEDGRLLQSNVISSQVDIHRRYGGVVPELASRHHIIRIMPIVNEALEEAEASWEEIEAVAVTHGPGLAGALVVGVNMAKGLALTLDLPLVGVNHLEGHIYAAWLNSSPAGPGAWIPPSVPHCVGGAYGPASYGRTWSIQAIGAYQG